MKAVLERVLDGERLSSDEAGQVLLQLMDEDIPAPQKSALLAALRTRGETSDEIRGMALMMRAQARSLTLPDDAPYVDTCGTGGDGSGSFNVSTATALLAAACGVPVVKHGNRSVSSKCGSADVLDELGIPLAHDPDEALRQLAAVGFCFLFAPHFHPAMKAVVPLRRAMGVRTIFNLLGPLSNPAVPPYQLLGAFSEDAAQRMAHALSGTPVRRAFVVHGAPSWDEATPCGPFVRFDVRDGEVTREVFDPRERYGMARAQPEALAGGDAPVNARLMRELFDGTPGAVRDAVLLNTALVLELVEQASTPDDALAMAAAAIDDGRAANLLVRLTTGVA